MPAPGHYPYQAPLDAYGNGGFRFAGMSHRGSLLCLPSGMHAWRVRSAAEVTLDSLQEVIAAAEKIDVLLIGIGRQAAAIDPALRQAMREQRIVVEAMTTGSAVRTYNVLLGEERAVAAALIAVEEAR